MRALDSLAFNISPSTYLALEFRQLRGIFNEPWEIMDVGALAGSHSLADPVDGC